MKNSFSIVIPTFKRHSSLFRLLSSLQKQTYKNFELVVVNNNIEDGLSDKIVEYNKTVDIQVKYINFPKDAKHGARNAGIRESNGDIIIFIDDDETCVEDFVNSYVVVFESNDNVVAAGGACKVVFEETPPKWIKDFYNMGQEHSKNNYIWGNYEPYDEMIIRKSINLWGGNIAVRRSVFKWTGWHAGLVNGKRIGPDDSGLVLDIAEKPGVLMAFIPEAVIYHHVTKTRTTIKFIRNSASYLTNSRMYFRYTKRDVNLKNIFTDMFSCLKKYWKTWLKDILYSRYRRDENSVDTQYCASIGYWEVRYLTWLLFDKDVIDFYKNKEYVRLKKIDI